jgi:hypothetical protein
MDGLVKGNALQQTAPDIAVCYDPNQSAAIVNDKGNLQGAGVNYFNRL